MNPNYATPLEVSSGGGLLDDFDVILNPTTVIIKDLSGTPYCGFNLTGQLDDGEEYEEFIPIGKTDFCVPSADGRQVVNAGKKGGGQQYKISGNFAGGVFLQSINEVGFTWDVDGWDTSGFSQLQGKFHLNRMSVTDKKGAVKKNSKGYDMENLVATSWTATEKKGAAAAKSTAKSTATATTGFGDADIEAAITTVIADGKAAKKDVLTSIRAVVSSAAEFSQVVKRLNDAAWITAADRPWTFAAGSFTLK